MKKKTVVVFAMVVHGAPEHVRPSLAAACQARSWDYVEDWGGEIPTQEPGTSRLLVTMGGRRLDTLTKADEGVVIAPSAERVAAACMPMADNDWPEAARMASSFLADAYTLVDQGAQLINAESRKFDIPILGTVDLPHNMPETLPTVPRAVSEAMAMYSTDANKRNGPITWLTDFLFSASDPPKRYVGAPIDLCGRARLVLFGPYLALPKGQWEVVAEFKVCPKSGPLHLGFEWGGVTNFETMNLAFDRTGVYKVTLSHYWGVPEAAHFRVWVRRAAFLGSLQLISMRCTRG